MKLVQCNGLYLREIALDDFDGELNEISDKYLCCNGCGEICNCGSCTMHQNEYEHFLHQNADCEEEDEAEDSREISESQMHELPGAF